MTRLQLGFACGDDTLGGTLDEACPQRLLQAACRRAPGSTGLLIVGGGNEIRSGAFNGQARLAAEIAAAGFPVFRFDRRGIGDSTGENRGFRGSQADIRAALAAFHALSPHLSRVVGFGNCDAASALMLFSGGGCDALVLSNPWTIEDGGDASAPPPAAVRARYAAKLRNPREVLRLVSGKVDLRKLARGIVQIARPKPGPSTLATEMKAGLARFAGPVRILLSGADRTAQIFADNWDPADPRIARCPRAGHSYVEPHAREWLRERLLAALRG